MAIFPKLIYRFNTIPIKILVVFFAEIDELTLKFTWKCKGPRIAKTLKKRNKVGGLTLPNFKTHYKSTVIKTVQYRHMNRQ